MTSNDAGPKTTETARIEQLEDALKLAIALLAPHEPGDSRAVSDEFVALAMVSDGTAGEECGRIIYSALSRMEATQ